MKITKNGIYDIAEADYHADPCITPSLSSTGAKDLLKGTPYHYWYKRNHPEESKSPALRTGSAAHMALLEPERFESFYHRTHEKFVKAHNKKWADDIVELEAAEAKGLTELKFKDAELIDGLKMGMERHKAILSKFMAAPKEQSAFWFDETFQIWRRARFDFFPADGGRIFADYKTIAPRSGYITDEALQRHIFDYGYYQQAAWYLDAVEALGLCDHPEGPVFLFVFQEKTEPHEIVIRQLSNDALDRGRMLNAKAMDLFAKGLETNDWPSYDSDPKALDLPYWNDKNLETEAENGAFALSHKLHTPYWYKGCETEEQS